MDLEKDAIKCWVATWAKNPSDAWSISSDIRQRLVPKLKKANIIPAKN
jgi:hypothetical protein